MNKNYTLFLLLLAAVLTLTSGTPVQAGEPDLFLKRATIKPTLIRLQPGAEQRFKIVFRATYLLPAAPPQPGTVKWSVNRIVGGSETLGTITQDGVYTAPAKAPSPNEINICAEVADSPNRHLFATVLVGEGEPDYQLVHIWSEPISEPKYLQSPHGIGLDHAGNILIADGGNSRVMRFSPEGSFLGEIGLGVGRTPGQFTEPRVVTSDAKGNIWVTDSKGDRPRIQVFSSDGQFQRIFAQKGILPGQLLRAHGMGFDPDHNLFVTDVDNFRVSVFTHSGEFLRTWGKVGIEAGQLNAPHGLAVDPSGDVFVTGYYGPTQKFDPYGNFLFAFGHGDPPDGPAYFHTMSGDVWGNVYLMVRSLEGGSGELQIGSKGKRLSIMKFNNNGDYITGWSLSEPDHRESWAVAGEDGRVYSLFQGKTHHGVQVFEPR